MAAIVCSLLLLLRETRGKETVVVCVSACVLWWQRRFGDGDGQFIQLESIDLQFATNKTGLKRRGVERGKSAERSEEEKKKTKRKGNEAFREVECGALTHAGVTSIPLRLPIKP